MKTCLMIAAFFAIISTGCNDNKQKSDTAISTARDSIGTNLEDLSASTDIKKLLCQDWENKEDAEDAALSGGSEGIETTYRGLSFFEDATVVENPRDNIRFGKWKMDEADKMIEIEFGKGARARYKIVAIGAKQMNLMNMADKKSTEYRADGKAYKNLADDPFYGTNNQWRVKPTHPETDSAIKFRTEQCVLFYAKFLNDNAERGASAISFTGLPTCFKWYHGGVSLTSKDKLEDKWLNCYYNREQAIKAQAMLERIISKKYKWNKNEKKWVKQSADVVRQMYDTLRAI